MNGDKLPSWDGIHGFLKEHCDQTAAKISLLLRDICFKALDARKIKADFGTVEQFREIAVYAAKDLQRLQIYQKDQVDPIKMAAYVGFWVRKLKPFTNGYGPDGKAIRPINEHISIIVSFALLTRWMKEGSIPPIEGIEEKIRRFYQNEALFSYIVHSMRFRTFGPHHFVIVMKMVCEF